MVLPCAEELHFGIERMSNNAFVSCLLQGLKHFAPFAKDPLPLLVNGAIQIGRVRPRNLRRKTCRVPILIWHLPPNLFSSKRNDRRHEMHQDIEDFVKRSLGGAPFCRIRPLAVKPVFDDIEIERAQVDAAEVVERVINGVELVVLVGLAATRQHGLGAVQNPSVQLIEIVNWTLSVAGLKS